MFGHSIAAESCEIVQCISSLEDKTEGWWDASAKLSICSIARRNIAPAYLLVPI